jgi:8-oxo-dGTP diphosphatase
VLTPTCLCLITRAAGGGREVLLGLKKTGFGAGKWVGLGGHIENGEKPASAAAREVREEAGLLVSPDTLARMATLTFRFPSRPAWDMTAEVFTTADYRGEPRESAELTPRWFPAGALPLDGMWDDARYWLPLVLAGRQVEATITFAADCATVSGIEPPLPAGSLSPGQPPGGPR